MSFEERKTENGFSGAAAESQAESRTAGRAPRDLSAPNAPEKPAAVAPAGREI